MTRQAVTKTPCDSRGRPASSPRFRHGREKLHYLNPVPIHQIGGSGGSGNSRRGKLAALSELKRQTGKGNVMSKPEFVYVIYIASTA